MKKIFSILFCSVFFLASLSALPITTYADCLITPSTVTSAQGGWGDTPVTTFTKMSQSFQATCTGQISTIAYLTAQNGSPPDSINLSIDTTNGGSALGISGNVTGTTFPAVGGGVCGSSNFTFASPVSVISGTTYYITVSRTGSTSSGTTWYYLCGNGSASTYPNGTAYRFNGSWVDQLYDAPMTITIASSSVATAVATMPLSRAFWWGH